MAPLIVITGPTASGKSALAVELAERFGGEIVCADSRTVYKGMDIGTAKPTPKDRRRVPHHLLDVVEPDQRFTLHDFQSQADAAIEDIRRRGKVPMLVGGTGLYIDSIVLDFELGGEADPAERRRLEAMSIDELQMMIKTLRIEPPSNVLNKRHLIRAIEQKGINTRGKRKPNPRTIVVAITTDMITLVKRITARAEDMFARGVLREAADLGEKYGWESEAMTGNIYPILRQVLEGGMTQEEAIRQFVTRDRQLVKRQLTWLRRHDYVEWYEVAQARSYLEGILDRWRRENVLP